MLATLLIPLAFGLGLALGHRRSTDRAREAYAHGRAAAFECMGARRFAKAQARGSAGPADNEVDFLAYRAEHTSRGGAA